jgi:DNA/RNA-binding domain of Phe-tRNA-synthetase-like protein
MISKARRANGPFAFWILTMHDVTFLTATDLFASFPGLTVFGLRVSNMKATLGGGMADALLAEAVAACALDPERVVEDPQIAGWREAYGLMGVKPSKFRSSIEALLRRAAKKGELAIPVPAVNLYNACSIVAKAPMGAYDVDRLGARTQIELRKADVANDRFDPLGGDAAAFPLNPSLVVYAAGDDVLCWGFNSRDSKLTCLTAESDTALFFSEAALPVHVEPCRQSLMMLREKFNAWGAACGEIQAANAMSPSFKI